jgi:uncharacterized membrane protein YeaQ/YmgE (transglycosylase-associated protein family)
MYGMYVLSWVIVGLITGWLTGKFVREGGYGPTLNVVMDVAGAFAGGSVARPASSWQDKGEALCHRQSQTIAAGWN